MKNKLDIQWFIEQHSDWEKILAEKPYSIDVKHDKVFSRNLMLLKYNLMNEPDFSIGLVKECRGLILDEDTLEVISYPFNKFGNFAEGDWVDSINWNSAYVTTKIDGSIIKIVKLGNELLISTNGCIDAFKAEVSQNQVDCPYKTYGDIVIDVLIKKFGSLDAFKDKIFEGYTYIFEMVSPYTKIVIPYPETDMYLIGCRNNKTFEETFFRACVLTDYFKTPDIHPLHTIDECIKLCEKMPWNEEGYVVVDADFHRVKVKSFAYLSVHRLANNGIMTYERAIELIRTNEVDEVLTYFPEHKKTIDFINEKIDELANRLDVQWDGFMTLVTMAAPRKEAAIWIQKNFDISGCGFAMLDGKVKTGKEWLNRLPPRNLVKALGLKDTNKENNI